MNRKHTKFFFASLFVFLLTSCIDSTFDLKKKINPDMVVGENTLIFPLGTSEFLTLKSIINNKDVKEIISENGKFFIVYHDTIDFKVPTQDDLKIENITGINASMVMPQSLIGLLPPRGSSAPADITIPLNSDETNFSISTSNQITRLDSVKLNTENNYSVVELTVNLTDLLITSGGGLAKLDIVFPSYFKLVNSTNGVVINGSTVEINLPLNTRSTNYKFSIAGFSDTNKLHKITTSSTLNIKKNDLLVYGSNPGIGVDVKIKNLRFREVYGLFNVDFTTNKGCVSLDGIDNLFNGVDDNLSFSQPRIFINTKGNIGIPLNANLVLKSSKQNRIIANEAATLMINPAQKVGDIIENQFGLGTLILPSWVGNPWSYTNINNLVKGMPDSLIYDIRVTSDKTVKQHFFTDNAKMTATYEAKIPLAFAQDFKGSYLDTIKNVFDAKSIEMIFTSGEVEIYGVATSSLPMKSKLRLQVMDENFNVTNVLIPDEEIIPGKNDISVKIAESEFPKMNNARHLLVTFELTSNTDLADIQLKETDSILVKLFLRKTGGIFINN